MLSPRERIGDFEIVRLIGKGGMGEVYEARQFHPDRPVALKVLAPWLADDDDALSRFWREAQVPANLDHPGIVRIISTGKTEHGIAYYTMHLVRGISLAQLISDAKATGEITGRTPVAPSPPSPGTPTAAEGVRAVTQPDGGTAEVAPSASSLSASSDFPHEVPTSPQASNGRPATNPTQSMGAATPNSKQPSRPTAGNADSTRPLLQEYLGDRYKAVARVGVQAARALAYAHGQGYLHRDIKPGNLMVDHHEHVYLVDFGLTRALSPEGNGTQPGVVPGTPWYMSPEQANGHELDPRSDIYSLGVTLYELATQGKGPFTASRKDKHAVLTQVRSGLSVPLRTLAPDIPAALESIILRAMSPRPDDRYPSAAEMARDLETLAEVPPGQATRTIETPPEKKRPRWPLALATAVALTAVAITLAVAVPRHRADDPPIPPPGNDGARPLKLQGHGAFPVELRTASIGLPISLIKTNLEPVWKERLIGNGDTRPLAFQTEVYAVKDERCTMIALADPDRAAFEFALDLNYLKSSAKHISNDMGIFFGWRRNPPDPDGHHRFIILRLDEIPTEASLHGHLVVGTGHLIEPRDGRPVGGNHFTPLPTPKAIIPLPLSKIWHPIKVEVRPDGFTVRHGPIVSRDFPMSWLREHDRNGVTGTSGAVGVWAARGRGFFRHATITRLEDP